MDHRQITMTEWNASGPAKSIDLPEEILDLAENNDIMII